MKREERKKRDGRKWSWSRDGGVGEMERETNGGRIKREEMLG